MGENELEKVTAQLVGEGDRLEFLPKHFGVKHMLDGERLVYAYMGKFCSGYSGGYWHFYELSNGGFYLAPKQDEPMSLAMDNHFKGDLSPDAAGIVASLYAINHLANSTRQDSLIDAYHLLRYFAALHPEGASIMGAID